MIVRRRDSILTEIGRAGLIAGAAIVTVFAAWWMKHKLNGTHHIQRPPSARSRRAEQMRQLLAQSIIGNPRNAILTILGPPRSSAGFSATPANTTDAFLRASTWYYVIDRAQRRAMVIEFEDDMARSAEFIHAVKNP